MCKDRIQLLHRAQYRPCCFRCCTGRQQKCASSGLLAWMPLSCVWRAVIIADNCWYMYLMP